MKQFQKRLNWLAESNPQWFREVKGRLQPRNLVIATFFSLAAQLLIIMGFRAQLPYADEPGIFNRYCLGSPPPGWDGYQDPSRYIPNNYCNQDLLGNLVINWQLWWLDMFLSLSVVMIVALLVMGTYLLIADLSREERRGTLNFIRMSPESAKNILLGKLLGVPILVYLAVGLTLPLHLGAGLGAHIPFTLILAFYAVLAAACLFYYRLSQIVGLAAGVWVGLTGWVVAGAVWFFTTTMTAIAQSGFRITHSLIDWIPMFYPGTALMYLVDATYLPIKTAKAFNGEQWIDLLWYGQPLWANALTGIGFILLNYALWSYWLGKGLERCFRNPSATLQSKKQSYIISACFVFILTGFILQQSRSWDYLENFVLVQITLILFTVLLIAATSPHRQTLQDWMRYRHQLPDRYPSLLKELMFAEKSPAILAIALNIAMITLYLIPTVLILPPADEKIPLLLSFILGANLLIICATIAQLVLLLPSPKRGLLATVSVSSFILLPPIFLGVSGIDPSSIPLPWLSTILPLIGLKESVISGGGILVSVLGQWTAIILLNLQMTKQLKRLNTTRYDLKGLAESNSAKS